jgi:hypothetical protein
MAKASARKCALLMERTVRQGILLGAPASLRQAGGRRVDANNRCSGVRCDPQAWSSGAARLPQVELLPRCALLVTHGGFNSVKKALAATFR